MDANNERIVMGTDVLNVIQDEVKPLPDHVLEKVFRGREEKTQILDGSLLEQHEGLEPYAYTHVTMTFDNEDDLIRCLRLLQWSDERMRARTEPSILWAWQMSYRKGMTVEFSVAWFGKEFFEERKDQFTDESHASYYKKFGLTVEDIKTRHEILKK